MKTNRFFLVATLALFVSSAVQADITLPGLFSDHMVLQRDMALPIWGTAQPGEQVTVTVGDRKASVRANEEGDWQVKLDPLPAGGPFELTVAGKNTITLKDVIVGEVWICSGQSNMGWTLNRCDNAEQEIAAADHPKIRLYTVPRVMADEPRTSLEGNWEVCSPQTAGSFSGVGYFFGRDLQKAIDVPVGLIDSSWGGTPAESWTSSRVLKSDPDYQGIYERWDRVRAEQSAERKAAKAAKKAQKRNAQSGPAPGAAASQPAKARKLDAANSPQRPSVLYNAMIHPLIPYAFRGAIWYQGESNAARAYQYRKLFPDMIRCWREAWGQGDFPFLFVQLANFKARQKEAYASDWAELREAQTMTLSLPKTGMAVIIDIGNPTDIHPTNKQGVGKRLSLAARAIAYGEKIEFSGPMFDGMSVESGKIRVKFKHTEGGLKAKGDSLTGFGLAGKDRKFVDASAKIDGNSVVVHSDRVPEPAAVRYGWADAPECNLYNGAGLPACPFRTDDWPGITANEK